MEQATIFDRFKTNVTFPPITLIGGGTLHNNDTTFAGVTRTFAGAITGTGGFSTLGERFQKYSFNVTNTFTGGYVANCTSRYVVEFNAQGAAGSGNVTVTPRSADAVSAVIRLGANNVFQPQSTLTLNGAGWNGLTNGDYGGKSTRLDMRTFNATVARLFIDNVEMATGTYTERL
jgi:hypothetical protein